MGTALETLWEQTGNMVPTFQSQKNKSHTPFPPPPTTKWAKTGLSRVRMFLGILTKTGPKPKLIPLSRAGGQARGRGGGVLGIGLSLKNVRNILYSPN